MNMAPPSQCQKIHMGTGLYLSFMAAIQNAGVHPNKWCGLHLLLILIWSVMCTWRPVSTSYKPWAMPMTPGCTKKKLAGSYGADAPRQVFCLTLLFDVDGSVLKTTPKRRGMVFVNIKPKTGRKPLPLCYVGLLPLPKDNVHL